MNPCIYILKPDTQIRTEVLKCPLFWLIDLLSTLQCLILFCNS
jgi:hypothetical protein